MRDGDGARRFPPLLRGLRHDGAQELGHKRLCAEGRPPENERCDVTKAALELTRPARRLAAGPAFRRVAREKLAIVSEKNHGWHCCRARAELENIGAITFGNGRRGVRSAEVDAERVRHECTP
jgi:hypothetical protein